MELETILKKYGESKGLEQVEFDKTGVCRLIINNNFVVAWEKSLDGKGFFTYSIIGTIPVGEEKRLGLMALSGNLFGIETGRANLGYDSHTRSLVLFQYYEKENLDFSIYTDQFNEFIDYLSYWNQKLETSETPSFPDQRLSEMSVLKSGKKMKIFFA